MRYEMIHLTDDTLARIHRRIQFLLYWGLLDDHMYVYVQSHLENLCTLSRTYYLRNHIL